MLTVYSSHGSPGASTTAIYLAAQWASAGRQVLLIEADGAAGTLSQKLGIQFTPGTASFMASGKPATAADLVDHAQDVLFNDLHVMPTPSSPAGAKSIGEKFALLGEELRDIADTEMAVIVDAGRLTPEARTSELTTSAAAVLIVTRDDAQLPSLEHVYGELVEMPDVPGPLGLVATVGPPALNEAEWRSQHGLNFVGSIELSSERGTDLSMFMSRGKRKSRKLRNSIDKLAEALYEFACPASASNPRVRLPSARPEIEETEPPQGDAAEAEAAAKFDAAPTPIAPESMQAGAPQDPAHAPPDELSASEHPAFAAPADSPISQPEHVQTAQQQLEHHQPSQPSTGLGTSAYGGQYHAAEHYGLPSEPSVPGSYPSHGAPVEDATPGPWHEDSARAAPPTHVPQPYAEPPQSVPYPEYQQGPTTLPAEPPAHAAQYPYPEQGAAAQWQPGYAVDAEPPPPIQHPYGSPPVPPEHDPYPEQGVHPGYEPDYAVPTVPTGSFRAWAEQLHGEQAGAESGGPPSSPGEGATA